MKRLFLSLILPACSGIVAQSGPIHIPDSLLQRGFQAQPVELTRVCLPPPWSYSENIFSVPASYVFVTVDSTPHRTVDSLKRAIDSLNLVHQAQMTSQRSSHEQLLNKFQSDLRNTKAMLLRHQRLLYTSLMLTLILVWMLFRVRRSAKRGKNLVLPHESAHEPTVGISEGITG